MRFLAYLVALCVALPALAADLRVGPGAPYATVDAALKAAKAGDVILLAPGDYPALTIGQAFTAPVTIRSEVGKSARVRSIHFPATARNITIKDLSIWRDEGNAGYMLRSYVGAAGIVIEGNDIRAVADSINYLSWPASKWLATSSTAVDLRGNVVVRNNTITGVGRALLIGPNSLVEGNVIDGITQDGIRVVSNTIVRNNVVKNAFKVDATHRDGIQSYSGSTVQNLTLEGNVIVAWTHPQASPLRGDMQGIGMFDGFYEDVTIKDNVIATTHYHGITIMGLRRATVTGNTVVNLDGAAGNSPWLKIDNHKDGRPSENVLVQGNRAMSFSGASAANSVVFTDNAVIADPAAVVAQLRPLWAAVVTPPVDPVPVDPTPPVVVDPVPPADPVPPTDPVPPPVDPVPPPSDGGGTTDPITLPAPPGLPLRLLCYPAP